MDDTSQPVSPDGKERRVVAGFAKIRGQGWEFFMQKYETVIGRNSKNTAVDIDLAKNGGGMNVSRKHARIYYSFENKRFEIEVLGKNGAYVDGQLRVPSDGPIPLNSQSLIVVGDFPFYFLLPTKKIERRRAPDHNGDYNRALQEGAEHSDGVSGDADFEAGNKGFETGFNSNEPLLEEKPKRVKRRTHPGENEDGDEIQFEGAKRLESEDATLGSAKKRKAGLKGAKHEIEDDSQGGREHPVDGSNFAAAEEWESGKAARGAKQEPGEEKPKIRKGAEGLEAAIPAGEKVRKKRKVEEETSEIVLLSEAVRGKRKHEAEENEQGGPSSGQKKNSKKKLDPPAESRGAREGSPEPSFQGRNLRVTSPPRRKWPGEGESTPAKATPVSPTRAAAKRAAAESAAAAEGSLRRGGSKGGSDEVGEEERQSGEWEVISAVAKILGEQDDPTDAVPLNKLSLQFMERNRELCERSQGLLMSAADGDASEQVHRPWLALANFLKRHPEHFVVTSQAKGRLVSWYAALRQA